MSNVIENLFVSMSCVQSHVARNHLAKAIRSEVNHRLECVLSDSSVPLVPDFCELELARNGQKLEAVKRYKNRANVSLMEAKKTIEKYM